MLTLCTTHTLFTAHSSLPPCLRNSPPPPLSRFSLFLFLFLSLFLLSFLENMYLYVPVHENMYLYNMYLYINMPNVQVLPFASSACVSF